MVAARRQRRDRRDQTHADGEGHEEHDVRQRCRSDRVIAQPADQREIGGHHRDLAELRQRFASFPIRNAGTLGGNVANGSPIGDSMPALIVLGTRIVLHRDGAVREMPLEDFYVAYQKNALEVGEFV